MKVIYSIYLHNNAVEIKQNKQYYIFNPITIDVRFRKQSSYYLLGVRLVDVSAETCCQLQ